MPILCFISELTISTLKEFPFPVKGQRLNIIEQAAIDYMSLGVFLLNDKNGVVVSAIEKAAHYQPEDALQKIFIKWLDRNTDCSWERLIAGLRHCQRNVLAKDVEDVLALHRASQF